MEKRVKSSIYRLQKGNKWSQFYIRILLNTFPMTKSLCIFFCFDFVYTCMPFYVLLTQCAPLFGPRKGLLHFRPLALSQTSPGFYVSTLKHCGKRRNCSLRAISPFPTVFSNHLENLLPFSSNLKFPSANFLNLEESKICRLGKG